MVVAEFTIIPIVEGSLRPYVKKAVAEVEKSGLKYEVGAMGTTIEGTLEEVFEVVKSAHRSVLAGGAGRVVTSIKIDDRGNGLTIEGKLEGFR
ncbi:MAG: MTH1187 family thiamine-binding protein [Thermoleophilia bacterium]